MKVCGGCIGKCWYWGDGVPKGVVRQVERVSKVWLDGGGV